jgi:hypothetical protein
MPVLHQHALVACARWETDYLVEWLVYHRLIGFDHCYLYCNDDDPTECFDRLLPFTTGPAPFVTFIHYPFVGLQMQMYKHFLRSRIKEVGWFIFLDIDEFLVLREDGTIGNFIARREAHADKIFFNMLAFGHSGFKVRPKGSVLLTYTRRTRDLNPYTKVMTRAETLDVARYADDGDSGFWHTWNFSGEKLNRAVNVLGEDLSDYFGRTHDENAAWLREGDRMDRLMAAGVIHHYQYRAEDEAARRMARGSGGEFTFARALNRIEESGRLAAFLAPFSAVEDTSLRDVWRYVLDAARNTSIVARPQLVNIALGKPATQSSVSRWSRGTTPEDDAAGVVGGTFSGTCNCHSGDDDEPWWQVDLLGVHNIGQIHLYNRCDKEIFRKRAGLFALETSIDGKDWTNLYTTQKAMPFGGTDGQPLIWWGNAPRPARYVRFRLLASTVLHIEAIEIYEEPYQPMRVEPAQYGPLTERIFAARAQRSCAA